MFFKPPKNDKEIIWTKHVIEKMKYYGLSESCLKMLVHRYQRQEQGIAPGTTALMRSAGTKRPTEIWLMYQPFGQRKKIITAWRYPGISHKKEVPIPEEILKELKAKEFNN